MISEGIADLAQAVVDEFYHNENKPKGKGVNVSVSVASLVPEALYPVPVGAAGQTRYPYREAEFPYLHALKRERSAFRDMCRGRASLRACLQGATAASRRYRGSVAPRAANSTAGRSTLTREKWMDSFAENGIDPFFYTARKRSFGRGLPWDHMDYGVTKKFLIRENEKAHRGEQPPRAARNAPAAERQG